MERPVASGLIHPSPFPLRKGSSPCCFSTIQPFPLGELSHWSCSFLPGLGEAPPLILPPPPASLGWGMDSSPTPTSYSSLSGLEWLFRSASPPLICLARERRLGSYRSSPRVFICCLPPLAPLPDPSGSRLPLSIPQRSSPSRGSRERQLGRKYRGSFSSHSSSSSSQ